MAGETIILTREDISQAVQVSEAVDAIETAMKTFEKGEDFLPPKGIYFLPVGAEGNSLAACITGYTKATNLLTMKLGQERTDNPARGLPTTNSWITAFSPETGELLAICDGALPTMYRTAAAAAVSVRHLARQDVSILTVIGAGNLGRQCVRAALSVRDFKEVLIYDIERSHADAVVEELAEEAGIPIRYAEADEACSCADVLITATNSRSPIVKSEWVKPGTHLACMGTDLAEKIECEPELLVRCRLIADFPEHVVQRGEVSQAIADGLLGADCFAGSLGQVMNGDIPGRTSNEEITLYDGVGIGVQDTAIVWNILQQIEGQDVGTRIRFS